MISKKDMKKIMNASMTKKNEAVILFVFAVLYFLGLLLFSVSTCPLFPFEYGYDSALFSLVGEGILQGKELYIDLFDHKGPVLFFIQALGRMLGGKTGTFIIQYLFGMSTLTILFHMAKDIMKYEGKYTVLNILLCFVSGYAYFFDCFENGNLTEEYSLLFISICFMLFVKYALSVPKNSHHPGWFSFVYGVCIVILAFIRINNAITIFSGVFVIIIYLIVKKEYKNVFMNVLFGLLGCLVVLVPILVYFGLHSSLNEMLYATFAYNFKYLQMRNDGLILNLSELFGLKNIPLFLSMFMLGINVIKKKNVDLIDGMTGVILLMNFWILALNRNYLHYYVIFLPVYIFVLCKYLDAKSIVTIVVISCLVLNLGKAGYSFVRVFYDSYFTKGLSDKYHVIHKSFQEIPESECDSVIGYQIASSYYLMGELIPSYKYYTMQEWWSKSDPQILIDFMDFVENDEPLWVLTLPDEDNETLLDILDRKYELRDTNEYFYMYRLVN